MSDSAPPQHWRRHAAVLALGAFAVGTDAFVISGVLPEIADSVQVSVGAAGQLVTVFSIAYALLAPVLTALTAHWPRRTVLVTALAIFAVGNVATALVPGYGLVLATRVVAAAGAAMFTSNASATAAALAGDSRRGKAISIVMLGMTSSLVLGAPLGTVLGSWLGWRSTMWFVSALALVVIPLITLRLPEPDIIATRTDLRQRLAPLRDRRVLRVLATTLVIFTGIYIPYTYISAIFDPATDGSGTLLALLLMTFGLAATAGNLMAGQLADRIPPRRIVAIAALALTVIFAVMPLFREAYPAALALIVFSGVASFSVTTPQQHQIIALAPKNGQPLLTSLYQSALYLAISLAGVIGALGLRIVGDGQVPLIAAGLVLVAAIMAGVGGWRPTAGDTPPPPQAADDSTSTPTDTTAPDRPQQQPSYDS
ncbi:MFS transporter [Streptomyces zagrosensis]|uniref:DHA1 family inner membrane transport protein n=1 Tax=Streptomyces zagrosensis TaxID=1042984 RepID=A0A7W9V1U6_9ACTN|nr:MFS transporter [Streptomyces zagrosensis]MBB5939663.1 DHA1 family inner membrane transport protein [Streptomyces zagrosensis]